jgi:uridine kinase
VVLDVGALRNELARRGARLIAIDGPGGSGKSTLARELAMGWPGAAVIEMDDFYRPAAERGGRPDAHGGDYDLLRLATDVLEPVHAGEAGRFQCYDWADDRLAEWHEVPAGAVVVLEGVYSTCARLRGYFDFTIWVDCPHEVRLRRGIERDGEAMRAVWLHQWMPAEQRYIDAERPHAHADLRLDGAGGTAGRPVFSVIED